MIELFPLTEVSGVSDDFGIVFFGQPFENDGGSKPSGIGENDLFDAGFFLP
jgi:hypothetical protein